MKQSVSSVPFSIQVKKEKDEHAAARSELPALPTFPDEDKKLKCRTTIHRKTTIPIHLRKLELLTPKIG